MHPQAPNTQTFLPACLLPTACDYNGLDCFDPLAHSVNYSERFAENSCKLQFGFGFQVYVRFASSIVRRRAASAYSRSGRLIKEKEKEKVKKNKTR
jgi:hypothetical protein